MLQITATITLPDYRSASYYGMFLRTRRAWLAAIAVLAVSAGYCLAASFGVVPASPLPIYLGAAYCIWMLLCLGGTERQVLRYVRAEGNLLDVPIAYTFSDTVCTVEIESRGETQRFDPAEIVCVYEPSRVFMIYMNAEQLFLLPKSGMTDRQIGELRAFFARRLKDRFSSRFFAKSTVGLRLR